MTFIKFLGYNKKKILFPCQRHKNIVNYSLLYLFLGFVKELKIGIRGGSKMSNNYLNNQIIGLVSLPFTL